MRFVRELGFTVLGKVIMDGLSTDKAKYIENQLLGLIGLQLIGEEMSGWTVPATVERVIDANTIACVLDLGWHISLRQHVQLTGIKVPKLHTEEGKAGKAFVADLLVPGDPVTVVSKKILGNTDGWGRVEGAIRLSDNRDLSSIVLREGHAEQA